VDGHSILSHVINGVFHVYFGVKQSPFLGEVIEWLNPKPAEATIQILLIAGQKCNLSDFHLHECWCRLEKEVSRRSALYLIGKLSKTCDRK
jgi:hypothetical protein